MAWGTLAFGLGLALVADEPATGGMCLLEDTCQAEAPVPHADVEAPRAPPCEAAAPPKKDERSAWSRAVTEEETADGQEHRRRLERPPRA